MFTPFHKVDIFLVRFGDHTEQTDSIRTLARNITMIWFIRCVQAYELQVAKRSVGICEFNKPIKLSNVTHSSDDTGVPSHITRTKCWPLDSQTCHQHCRKVSVVSFSRGRSSRTHLHDNLRSESRPAQGSQLSEAQRGSDANHRAIVPNKEAQLVAFFPGLEVLEIHGKLLKEYTYGRARGKGQYKVLHGAILRPANGKLRIVSSAVSRIPDIAVDNGETTHTGRQSCIDLLVLEVADREHFECVRV